MLCRCYFDPHAQSVTQYTGHDQTTVLRAATSVGDVIVKILRSPERHEQELHAYRQWVPAVAERAPQLLAEIDEPPAIIVTALTGRPVTELDLTNEQQQHAYQQAGALLRAWHDAEPPRDTPNMAAWLANRGERWLDLAQDILPTDERADIRAHLRDLATLGPIPAVPCHLDFTPRNLIYDTADTIHVIDFEHSRFDLAARDLVRLTPRPHRAPGPAHR
ncbi:aminoglycoside phosphotransferase family protein [Nocardia sp. NBC_00565]|uniref:aminoglycoside phosphotransferase family protein n=1 Tax=Nocardia sp. NBC_00565 TaxID=2975993 RepID=UPI002E80DED8|nr:aminoglycoside phosphotransferase family protein [Nocardia sp. NBC_00565]WUC08018.1 aminoglycoside phosphotransferase family protein [Nocardia sp. NBC_00565]